MVIKKYVFDKKDKNDKVAMSKDFVITDWDYKGIYFFDRGFTTIDKLFIEQNIRIDEIFCEFDRDKIALFCPNKEAFFIVDSLTREIRKIILKDLELDEDSGFLTPLYYWKNGIFIVQFNAISMMQYFSISVENNTIEVKPLNCIASECPSFYKFILKIQELGTAAEVVTIFPESDQFTYKNALTKEIGFIDCKNNIHIIAAYDNDDIHDIYLVQKKFIVIHCKAIVSITAGTKEIILQADESCEFRESSYDISSETIYVMSRFWKGSDKRMALYSLNFS